LLTCESSFQKFAGIITKYQVFMWLLCSSVNIPGWASIFFLTPSAQVLRYKIACCAISDLIDLMIKSFKHKGLDLYEKGNSSGAFKLSTGKKQSAAGSIGYINSD